MGVQLEIRGARVQEEQGFGW